MNLTPETLARAGERLALKLAVRDSGCIEWTGGLNTTGYGQMQIDGKHVLVHRLAWELAKGPIPPGLNVLHHCDNPPCCQTEPTEGYPEGHLFPGTQKQNVDDMVAKGRHNTGFAARTHCPQKHSYDEANTYMTSRGSRYCRACGAASARVRRARQKEVVQ